jgi:hypothetical protein
MALIQAWHQRQPYAGRTFWFKATLEQAVAHGEMVGKAVRSLDGAPERMKLGTRMSLRWVWLSTFSAKDQTEVERPKAAD